MYDEFDALVQNVNNISRPRDITSSSNKLKDIYIGKVSDEIFNSGINNIKKYSDNIQLVDALFKMPDLFKIILDKKILSIANDFFGVAPAFTYLKIVRNFANDLEEFDTQYFHIDENSSKILKVFIYLNDVDESGGPFCYVKNSHIDKEKYWGIQPRWSPKKIEEIFGQNNISKLSAKKGDVIIANTNGFHRGIKPISYDRNIIIINYCIHEEYSFNYKKDLKIKIPKKITDSLDNDLKNIFDLCNVVD